MIRIQHLSLSYGSRLLASDISFTLADGECLLLAGPNGSGKSTLLRTLASSGKDIISSHSRPDQAHCLLIPTGIPKVKGFSVEEFVRTGCYRESDWVGRLNPQIQKRLDSALQVLGLDALKERDISTLSDGEFQKACIAVALTKQADVLLLDEPTAYLDVDNRLMVLKTLREVAEKTGIGIIFSSHDLHEALRFAHRIIAFTGDGRFLESTEDNRTDILSTAFPSWTA